MCVSFNQVNDVPLCPLTHEEAVIFLRQAADTVKLRFYRDNAQTPITSMSPTNIENKTICNNIKQKTCLRYVMLLIKFNVFIRDTSSRSLPFLCVSMKHIQFLLRIGFADVTYMKCHWYKSTEYV